jgi:hypothetical protein
MLPFLVSVLFTFYIQGVLKKLKKFGCRKVKCAPSLPANYTTYRGRQKQRAISRIEGDAEGLSPVYSLASPRCSEYFRLAVLCVFEVTCTGRARDLLSGLPFSKHKLHNPVA